MKLGIMESKEQPSVFIQTPASQDVENDKKQTSTKKYVVIGVTAVILSAIVITGITLCFVFFTQTTEKLIKHTSHFKDDRGNDVDEEAEADLNANTVFFTVNQGKDGIHHIVHDYNRKLATTKVEENNEPKCYLHALNMSMNALQAITDEDKKDEDPVTPMRFNIDPNPITNANFMAPRAVSMCKGTPVHWAIPDCIDDESKDGDRQKRRWCIRVRACVRVWGRRRCYTYRRCW